MKKLLLVLSFLLVFSGCQIRHKTSKTPDFRSSIFRIYAMRAMVYKDKPYVMKACGTTFLTEVKGQPVLVTASHLMHGSKQAYVLRDDKTGVYIQIKRTVYFPILDVTCLFLLNKPADTKYLELGKDFSVGDKVLTVGYWRGDFLHFEPGEVTTDYTILSTNVASGMSGGPIFKGNKVIGILSARRCLDKKMLVLFSTVEEMLIALGEE